MSGLTVVVTIFVVFLVLCLTTIPIGISLGLAVLFYVFTVGKINMSYIATNMFASCDSFPLMAIPFFILAGALMEGGGLSKRLVNFCDTLVGNFTGGLAMVTVITSMFFGAISGSAPATVAAIGTIMVPTMVEKGYDKKFTLALVAASGCLGTIIPPSIPMVMFGVATGASISSMFMGGFLPGIVCGLSLILISYVISRRNGFVGNGIPFSIKRTRKEFLSAIWALLVPIIILGGIYGGLFTPTEAAVTAIVYGFIAGKFIYKELNLKTIYLKFADSVRMVGSIVIIVSTGTILGRCLTLEQAPKMIAEALTDVADNRFMILLLINVILLITGCFMETNCAILILGPILYPVAQTFGVDIIHFGVMMVVNLSIGFITPPVGVNLFVACGIGGVPFTAIAKKIIPFLLFLLAALAFITYVPQIVMFLPNLMTS
jgi:C4-dicarboxylate transporter DctM subunit